jgi:hypothetical protein
METNLKSGTNANVGSISQPATTDWLKMEVSFKSKTYVVRFRVYYYISKFGLLGKKCPVEEASYKVDWMFSRETLWQNGTS